MGKPVVLRSRGSFRTEVEAGPHQWVLDEPVDAGGGGEGPTPYDMLAAALGSCTAMTLHFYAKREKLPLEGVDLSVTHDRQNAKDCSDCSTQNGYIHRFRVEIQLLGPLDVAQRAKLLTIAARCPVAKTLQSEIRIEEVLATAPI
ncbi:MAG TPA: OsmC family protein [Thermoanaerobaculia bacterium]|nr:OsmC family protein [Thermoanaerobaculia bacterium]